MIDRVPGSGGLGQTPPLPTAAVERCETDTLRPPCRSDAMYSGAVLVLPASTQVPDSMIRKPTENQEFDSNNPEEC